MTYILTETANGIYLEDGAGAAALIPPEDMAFTAKQLLDVLEVASNMEPTNMTPRVTLRTVEGDPLTFNLTDIVAVLNRLTTIMVRDILTTADEKGR